MGLLDYYKQFDGLSSEEVSEQLRLQAQERRAKELERVEPVDLSRTTWPGLPHPYVVNSITYAARRGLNRYADPHATELRSELAHRHGIDASRVVVGNGAAQLLATAAGVLLEPLDELVTAWPSYPLYPLLARRSHGHAVPVPGFGAERLLAAVNDRTRIVAVCNPNDPTGELMSLEELDHLLGALPERVVTFLDEALVDYADEAAMPDDGSLGLLERHERLLVFRTFSKAWGLAGLRCGYAIGPEGSQALLEQLEPDLGVDELAQAGALEALKSTGERVAKGIATVRAQRERVVEALRGGPVEVQPSQANVLWMRTRGMDGAELARRLERHGVIVQPGGAIGQPDHVRASVHLPQHAERLMHALEQETGGRTR
ncbi:MAG TPA: aminotransferase class I/II-fold pyridoxal phosphate-dependent enzyme [Solirubrobacteraceae bacterium]|nr:aminotransferase class I/II-fold pyridoxal phosphate-dependent enzyme [Solirubrobacteraceae bacterium]